ncbi:hypothetical protein RRG08_058076 [Elysia crispata]|uniref:Uncharacterized protein n=1 Tax=Elysia crispata TaxID=231223 RepID=A0AAE0YGW7_9GAST|nr:hypothetical protein RRG08_058076 [Elysia crispata]
MANRFLKIFEFWLSDASCKVKWCMLSFSKRTRAKHASLYVWIVVTRPVLSRLRYALRGLNVRAAGLSAGPADAQKFALGHWGDAGPFWHSEDISRGLNSGLDLYNGLPKIFKRDCFYGRGRLAHLLVGSVEVRSILGREAGALVDAQRPSYIDAVPFESRGCEELPRLILVG